MDSGAALSLSNILNALNHEQKSVGSSTGDAFSKEQKSHTFATSFGEQSADKIHVVEWKDAEEDCTQKQCESEKMPQKVRILPVAPQTKGYKLLQLWEGIVESVDGNDFTAVLSDRTTPDTDDEIAEFSMDDVMPDDQHLVVEGALFIWAIAYEISGGTRYRKSEIRFRRMGVWTKTDINNISKSSTSIRELLGLSVDKSKQQSTC